MICTLSRCELVMNFEEIIHNQSNEIQTLKSALITAEKRCEQYAQAYDQIQHQLKELIRNRFGKKSERFIDPEHPQLDMLGNPSLFAVRDAAGMEIEEDI